MYDFLKEILKDETYDGSEYPSYEIAKIDRIMKWQKLKFDDHVLAPFCVMWGGITYYVHIENDRSLYAFN